MFYVSIQENFFQSLQYVFTFVRYLLITLIVRKSRERVNVVDSCVIIVCNVFILNNLQDPFTDGLPKVVS